MGDFFRSAKSIVDDTRFRKLWRDDAGNAVIFAPVTLVLIATAGGVIDNTGVSAVRQKMQNAADSAALAGVISAQNSSSGGSSSSDLSTAMDDRPH